MFSVAMAKKNAIRRNRISDLPPTKNPAADSVFSDTQ